MLNDDFYEDSHQYRDYIDDYQDEYNPHENRLKSGECFMFCNDCGSKLYSFDGELDASRKCPYLKNGKCEP